MAGVTISYGGVLPNIHQVLLPKKNAEAKNAEKADKPAKAPKSPKSTKKTAS